MSSWRHQSYIQVRVQRSSGGAYESLGHEGGDLRVPERLASTGKPARVAPGVIR